MRFKLWEPAPPAPKQDPYKWHRHYCWRPLIIKGNVIYNSDTSVYNGIDVGTLSTTGIVANNRITALYATTLTKIFRDGDLTSMDNFFANDVSERGSILVPATSSV